MYPWHFAVNVKGLTSRPPRPFGWERSQARRSRAQRVATVWLGFSLVSQISRDEVAHLARLARLALTDTELDSFVGQLDAILTHVSQIQAVDVTGVEATDNPLKDVNVTRPDETAPCLTQAEALAEAPEVVDGRFAVPQILGESQ
jgi:aspartyl-tRNA(Asn)/glutamyl-tRNA(Gln) amidotransferase subunit C